MKTGNRGKSGNVIYEASVSAKERICSILNVSSQSTECEIHRAYREHIQILSETLSTNPWEEQLLKEKKKVLIDAFNCYKEQDGNGTDSVSAEITKRIESYPHRVYGFNIPCVFWLLCHGTDYLWDTCCCIAWVCGDDDPGDGWCSACYDGRMTGCNCLQVTDTILVVAAVFAVVVWFINRVTTVFGPIIQRRRQRIKRESLEAGFEKEYLSKLEEVLDTWKELSSYDVDLRVFLRRLDKVGTTEEADADFNRMLHSLDNEYKELDKQWKLFVQAREKLKRGNNLKYYEYIRSQQDIWARYAAMFNRNNAPWIDETNVTTYDKLLAKQRRKKR